MRLNKGTPTGTTIRHVGYPHYVGLISSEWRSCVTNRPYRIITGVSGDWTHIIYENEYHNWEVVETNPLEVD